MRRVVKKIRSRLLLDATLAVVLLSSLGCATADLDGFIEEDRLSAELRQRGLDPTQVVVPFLLDDEMRDWIAEIRKYSASPIDRLYLLQAKLLNPKEMSIQYQWGYTGTAAEVFRDRKANCLAFTNLFVGMARELGVEVYFLSVEDAESYRREGDLVVVSDHIVVGYGSPIDRVIFDFSESAGSKEYRFIHNVSDLTAIAMFHSNRGAEALQLGNTDVALDWLRKAVRVDADLANAWINLGVALRRQGDVSGAEAAYKKSLEIDPRIYSAYHNLTSLLHAEGRSKEAEAYQHALARAPSRNPYTYLSLGDISFIGGRLDEAEKFYRRAINLDDAIAEGYAAMGQLMISYGDLRRARRMLRKAEKIETANPRTERLRAMLERQAQTTLDDLALSHRAQALQ